MKILQRKYILLFLVTAGACFGLGELGLQLIPSSLNPFLTAVWIPAGIAIAVFIIYGYELWPAVFIGEFISFAAYGSFAAHPFASSPVTVFAAIIIAGGSTLGSFVAAYLINRFAKGRQAFDRARGTFLFSLFAGAVGPLVAASIGIMPIYYFSFIAAHASFGTAWWTMVFGNMGSGLVAAPFIIVWTSGYRSEWDEAQRFEAVIVSALLIALAISAGHNEMIASYLITPFLVWGAFRFGQRETATGVLAISIVFLAEALNGFGPFVTHEINLNDAMNLLAATMAAVFVTVMAINATANESRTAQKILAEKNAEIEKRSLASAAIIESVGEGLIFVDRRGYIVIVNAQAEQLLGRRAEDLMGKLFYETLKIQDETGNDVEKENRPLYQALFKGAQISTRPMMATLYYLRGDGTRFPVSLAVTPVIVEGRIIGAIDVFRDITQGRALDRAKSEFVSFASHELRTPLSIIAMYAELLRRKGNLFEKHDERECRAYAGEIEEAVRRMATLINDFLNVSRIEAQSLIISPSPTDVIDLCREVLRESLPRIREKKLNIRTQFKRSLGPVTTDRHLLKTVVTNLVTNAVRYTPQGGRIMVSAGAHGREAVISVSDTGFGIPKDVQGEVFKKFFRAKNVESVGGGTGLGLYVAKAMVEQLSGRISFRSQEGKGSVFSVRLPINISNISNAG